MAGILSGQLGEKMNQLKRPQTDSEPIALAKIQTHPDNYFHIDQDELEVLAEDIQLNGLNSRLLVRKLPENHPLYQKDKPYQLIGGERRYQALGINAAEFADCKVIECSDEDAILRLITDNVSAREISAADRLQTVERLEKLFVDKKQREKLQGRVQSMVAAEMNLKESQVGRYQRILKRGSDQLVRMVQDEEISVKAASLIARMSISEQEEFLSNAENANDLDEIENYLNPDPNILVDSKSESVEEIPEEFYEENTDEEVEQSEPSSQTKQLTPMSKPEVKPTPSVEPPNSVVPGNTTFPQDVDEDQITIDDLLKPESSNDYDPYFSLGIIETQLGRLEAFINAEVNPFSKLTFTMTSVKKNVEVIREEMLKEVGH